MQDTCKGSFTLAESERENDTALKWLVRKFNEITLSGGKDQKKFLLSRLLSFSVNGPQHGTWSVDVASSASTVWKISWIQTSGTVRRNPPAVSPTWTSILVHYVCHDRKTFAFTQTFSVKMKYRQKRSNITSQDGSLRQKTPTNHCTLKQAYF